MMANIWWSLPLTLIVFFAARKLAARYKFPLLNPLLVAMVVIIPFLMLTGISYDSYFKGSEVLNDLLQPAVVALAYPLYEQLHQIRARWKSIITICFIGSVVAMVTGTSVALLMGASPEIAASILPKSVTTPIAMAVWRQYWRYSGNQRSLRDFSSASSARYLAIHCLMRCVFVPKLRAVWQWGLPRTPSVRRAAPSWIIRKVHLVR